MAKETRPPGLLRRWQRAALTLSQQQPPDRRPLKSRLVHTACALREYRP